MSLCTILEVAQKLAEDILLRHAAEVRDSLKFQHVDGDGHCMFRAAAYQTTAGEQQ